MARTPRPGTRDRILDNATRLFDEHGARAVGMQQIIDECGCGKNMLYREFASKDDLVVAYLDRCHQEWTAIVDDAIRPLAGDPARQLVAIVAVAAGQVAAPDYRGCPFRTAHAQFRDPSHPVHRAAARHLDDLQGRLRALAGQAGARDPDVLTDRLTLVVDGIYVNGAAFGGRGAATAAVDLAGEIVAAAVGDREPGATGP
jgi:AcrR family transcriptional regulator